MQTLELQRSRRKPERQTKHVLLLNSGLAQKQPSHLMKEMGLTLLADPQTRKTTASESGQEPGLAHRRTQKLEKVMEPTPE